eukprot:TRINITY_DN5916_c0_g1_i1.p1 TRINITY_DN5916_c0_g1~~TRINITY_DN5916_c0_g1_i1.p1  ORF type:complete len:191 (-),score=31.39 TRINITY_DN5916_c0_g1_i1:410-982(-)
MAEVQNAKSKWSPSELMYTGLEYAGAGDLRTPRSKRLAANQIVTLLTVFGSALAMWRSLGILTLTPSPIVVVLSGSMEPAIYRGDLLLVHNHKSEFKTGDIVVFKTDIKEVPIVHRVVEVHRSVDGHLRLLTKGDNNNISDRGFYSQGGDWLDESKVVGRIAGFIPYVGMVGYFYRIRTLIQSAFILSPI